MTITRPLPGKLRRTADDIERESGGALYVEIIEGALVMRPAPPGRHALTVVRVRDALGARAARNGLAAADTVSIPLPDDPDDYATPDLAVLPPASLDTDDWLIPGDEFVLAVEVASPSESRPSIAAKTAWYSRSLVGALLYLSPGTGEWTVSSEPRGDGTWVTTSSGVYGEKITLPEPLGALDTTDLPRYGD
ncbi:Uma2 family endonuclease [Actinomadura logoneensis]|uniref:Uma2 family endonuclease n=1 Tax=Actinomadura logoneensis TaxID=2293572 RepID=A0A372JN47_9ACTN|nr:Uma2 family endonuclease [Actinomadura logoneensis]RFU41380.1 Uma2 family endonuclease [Actinomadura logoneensis]